MSRIVGLRDKARKHRKKVVLPEGEDKRVVKAASFIAAEGLADVFLLGKVEEVKKTASEISADLEGVRLIYPPEDAFFEEAVTAYYEARKHKGITPEDARKLLEENFVFFGALMTRQGKADAFVAGASHTTSDVARAAIHCLDIDREIGTVSSSFIMEIDDCPYGEKGLFIFADCGVIPHPSPRQLAGIAIASSDMFQRLFGVKPRVALLSYSTKGSAADEAIDRVRDALERVKKKRPDIMVDGELQPDAALVPEVAEIKCPNSSVAGKANILIFPNLESGNISYKLTQRLGKARAVGPILQGLVKPCSDLSRGCSWEDVVDAAVVTSLLAEGRR